MSAAAAAAAPAVVTGKPASPPANAAARRQPVRTCVACRTSGGKRGLLRIVRLPDGAGVALDPTGKKSGRGAYVCPTPECIGLALKRKALERSLKTPIPPETAAALEAAAVAESPQPTAAS